LSGAVNITHMSLQNERTKCVLKETLRKVVEQLKASRASLGGKG
jgi:hypothetical protein